jgi:hypothetical protein
MRFAVSLGSIRRSFAAMLTAIAAAKNVVEPPTPSTQLRRHRFRLIRISRSKGFWTHSRSHLAHPGC